MATSLLQLAALQMARNPMAASLLQLAALQMARNPMTCLLYTSPSPRDGLLSRMPSSA